jgi:putative Holliday junction resolvase
MRILAIDHGSARCGCALCDPTETIVHPIDPVEPPDVAKIAEIVSGERVERVVVGLPLGLDGSEGEQARIVREFSAELEGAIEVPVDLYDERLTTVLAGASRRAGARAAEDSLAAAHLLQSYLDSREARR